MVMAAIRVVSIFYVKRAAHVIKYSRIRDRQIHVDCFGVLHSASIGSLGAGRSRETTTNAERNRLAAIQCQWCSLLQSWTHDQLSMDNLLLTNRLAPLTVPQWHMQEPSENSGQRWIKAPRRYDSILDSHHRIRRAEFAPGKLAT